MANKKKEETNAPIDVLEIKNDLVKYIDSELDKKVDATFNQKIRKEFLDEIDNSNRRLIRDKNKRNFLKNVIIIILILIIFYLVYLLYKANYFDKYFIKDGYNIVDNNNDKNKDDNNLIENNKKDNLEELKEQYASLLDNIIISMESKYLEEFYTGNLTDNLKKYLALNQMNFEELEVEEDYNIIEAKTLELAYNKIFNDNYQESNFEYNGTKVRYLNKMNSYITDNILVKNENNIIREIIEINLNNQKVEITTVEALSKDNKLFNILSDEEIEEYNGNSILNYQSNLNKLTYVFENNKLIELRNDK